MPGRLTDEPATCTILVTRGEAHALLVGLGLKLVASADPEDILALATLIMKIDSSVPWDLDPELVGCVMTALNLLHDPKRGERD